MDGMAAINVIADRMDDIYSRTGIPNRVGQLGIPKDDLINIARETVKNLNSTLGLVLRLSKLTRFHEAPRSCLVAR